MATRSMPPPSFPHPIGSCWSTFARTIARSALALGQLQLRDDGKVIWNLRKPWRGRTRAFVLDPLAFLERLVALIPHPREHQITYHGVLAPAFPLRDFVVPGLPSPQAQFGW